MNRAYGFLRSIMAVMLGLLLLVACAAVGEKPLTFGQKLNIAYKSTNALYDTTAILVSANKISADSAAKVRDQADTARVGLDMARVTFLRECPPAVVPATALPCDAPDAEDRLLLTMNLLVAVRSYLTTLEGKK